jgi:hypothetical protein
MLKLLKLVAKEYKSHPPYLHMNTMYIKYMIKTEHCDFYNINLSFSQEKRSRI